MWAVQGLYVDVAFIRDEHWEDLTHHDTKAEALAEAKVYDENEPQYPHRVRPVKD